MAAAEAKPGDVGFIEIVRLKCEHETGFVAPLGVRGVMPLEDRLHATQGSVVSEEMREAHHGPSAWLGLRMVEARRG